MDSIKEKDFYELVKGSKVPIVVDFWADWCQPCKQFEPIIEEVAKEFGKLKFIKVNADESQDVLNRYEIMSVPTLILMDKGEVKATSIGAVSRKALKEWLEDNL